MYNTGSQYGHMAQNMGSRFGKTIERQRYTKEQRSLLSELYRDVDDFRASVANTDITKELSERRGKVERLTRSEVISLVEQNKLKVNMESEKIDALADAMRNCSFTQGPYIIKITETNEVTQGIGVLAAFVKSELAAITLKVHRTTNTVRKKKKICRPKAKPEKHPLHTDTGYLELTRGKVARLENVVEKPYCSSSKAARTLSVTMQNGTFNTKTQPVIVIQEYKKVLSGIDQIEGFLLSGLDGIVVRVKHVSDEVVKITDHKGKEYSSFDEMCKAYGKTVSQVSKARNVFKKTLEQALIEK